MCCSAKFRLGQRLRSGHVAEGHPDQLGRRPPEQPFGALGHEQEATLGVAPVDDVRRRLDQLPEAGLGLVQLALEPLPLGDVAGHAVDRRQAAVLEAADNVDLERDGRAVATHELDPRGVNRRRVGDQLGEARGRRGLAAGRHELAEMPPDRGVAVPAERVVGLIAEERVAALGVGREDQVGR